MESNENGRSLPDKAVVVQELIPLIPAVQPGRDGEQDAVIETIDDVLQRKAMPESHQSHCQDVTQIGCRIAILEPFAFDCGEDKAVVNVVAEPKRKAHVPPVPKVTDIAREEWPIEIFRSMDAE